MFHLKNSFHEKNSHRFMIVCNNPIGLIENPVILRTSKLKLLSSVNKLTLDIIDRIENRCY